MTTVPPDPSPSTSPAAPPALRKGRLVASVLFVEADPVYAEYWSRALMRAGYVVTVTPDIDTALKAVQVDSYQLVVLDLTSGDEAEARGGTLPPSFSRGAAALQTLRSCDDPPDVVVMTACGSIHCAVEAMRLGAYDFLIKPVPPEKLLVTLRNALERRELTTTVAAYHHADRRGGFQGFIGSSPAMHAVYRMVENAASSRATVFVLGESGTGKEVCAQAIHRMSARSRAPFVPLNCAAIPKDLIESEVFGHVKGAFTGAIGDRDGAARQADGGTLFLDEICEMDLNLQSKLLRFLQTGSFQRVGGSRLESVDVRILCASNRDPLVEVKAGRFREDLYYRLHVVPIVLPPLRERDEDVLEIARALLEQYSREEKKNFKAFAPEVERILLHYDWPGNVRQLQNVIRNIVVMNSGDLVTPDMVPPPAGGRWARPFGFGQPAALAGSVAGGDGVRLRENFGERSGVLLPTSLAAIRPLAEVEREAIENAIALCEGNIPKAAALLGVSPSTLYRKKQGW